MTIIASAFKGTEGSLKIPPSHSYLHDTLQKYHEDISINSFPIRSLDQLPKVELGLSVPEGHSWALKAPCLGFRPLQFIMSI
jgi:hypothetical protein